MTPGEFWSETVPLTALQEAVARNPESAELRAELGHALLSDGRNDEALVEFQTAIRLADPADSRQLGHLHLFVGEVLAARGDRDAAIAAFEAALHHRPGHVTAHWMLGVLLNARGERAAARGHWRQVIEAHESGEVPELYQVTEARRLLEEHPED
ncbi:MAG: tetratricopeptide repeat protein [Armatimonadota bacterium]